MPGNSHIAQNNQIRTSLLKKVPAKGFNKTRLRFIKRFKERFFLRFHMSLILIAAALTGLLTSKLLLLFHLENIIIRFPLAVVVSYLAFIVLIKIWLCYISSSKPSDSSGVSVDSLPDVANASFTQTADADPAGFGGGLGGSHGGGGVTGSFDGPVQAVQAVSTDVSSSDTGTAGEIAGAAGDVASDLDEGIIILIVLGILLAVIFGASLYILYAAPNILAEAAFNFLLASGLRRNFKAIDNPDWIGSVLRATYKPFLAVLIISIMAAIIIHEIYPEVTKLSDLISLI
jgi:hypothetical protein